jgi:glutaredoxin
MIKRLLVAFVVAIVTNAAAAADMYRWEDERGNVYYSDKLPPPGARNVERSRFRRDSDQTLPYRLQVAVSKFPVTLFVTDCGEPCDLGRGLLLERGVPHTMMDATRPDVQEKLVALTGGERAVPVIVIGRKVIKGFDDDEWHDALSFAGYPSEAMIEVTPTIPQPEPPQEAPADSGDEGEESEELEDTEAEMADVP